MVSQRALAVDSSGIRRVFDLAAKLKDPINLSIGQPDFDAFPTLKAGAIAAINSARNGYTVTQGIDELRELIAEQYSLSDLECFVTSGVSGGLMLAYMTLLDPGDAIMIPDPYFGMYRDQAKLLSAEPIYYNTYPDFRLRIEELEQTYSPRVKAIVVANPGNPTGVALSQSEVDLLIDFARKREIWLISDEIYSAFSYDQQQPTVLGKYERVILLNGFSKSHGVPGWRIGYAIGPTEIVQQMLKLQQYSFVCAPSVAQWGLVAGMKTDFGPLLSEYRKKRDFLVTELSSKYTFEIPGGAFYLFPEAPGGSGAKFVEECIAKNLLLVPGGVFSRADTHFRISFSAPMAQLAKGAEILKSLAG